ncbi:MAG: TIGR03790 family protein [Burkholderiaceae bacterium]
MRALSGALALAAALLAACGGGGGGGGAEGGAATLLPPSGSLPSALTLTLPGHGLAAADLAVLVAEGDALSEAIAAYYQGARGIPAANILRVRLPGPAGDAISASDFAALKADIDARLPAGVQATLVSWSAPSRVAGSACTMSLTSALAFGYDARYCGSGCVATAASAYYDSESSRPWADHQIRPAMMLGARTLDAAKALIDRGVAADASRPGGEGWLMRTSDSARSVRYPDYAALPAQWAGSLALNVVDNSAGAAGGDSLVGKSNVLFYFTGLARVPDLASNGFRPGAAADALTSTGGVLPGGGGQMPITDWLDAGATASYGTVAEPCNFVEKFSRASILIDQYWRGATLIEAYWKSVQWPGQGLFIGEPLARPWPEAASLTISAGRYLISSRALRPGASYALQYRTAANANWVTLANFSTSASSRAGLQSFSAPLAPGEATQLRWLGPCGTDRSQQCQLAISG